MKNICGGANVKFIKIKTRPIIPPKDNIFPVLDKYLPKLVNGDILIITSKILAIHQGRCVKIKKDTLEEKNKLIMSEADWYVPPAKRRAQHWHLTIKDNTLIADAGIDASNGDGYYILWPKNLPKLLKEIRNYLMKKHKIKKLGVVVIDSHLMPLRAGTVGVATGLFGIDPLINYIGKPDIFGKKLRVTRANVADALAGIANLLMGEGAEKTPLLLIRGAKQIKFTNKDMNQKSLIKPEDDIFAPLLKVYRKRR